MRESRRIAIPGKDRAAGADPHANPADLIGPGERWVVDGLDWSWAFVIYRKVSGRDHYLVGSNGELWTKSLKRLKGKFVLLRGTVSRKGYRVYCLSDQDRSRRACWGHQGHRRVAVTR